MSDTKITQNTSLKIFQTFVKFTRIVKEKNWMIVNFVIGHGDGANVVVVQVRVDEEGGTENCRDYDHNQDDDAGLEIDVLGSWAVVDEVDHEEDGEGVQEGRELGEELVQRAHDGRVGQGRVTPV